MTDTDTPIALARAWLARQVATAADDLLDEGDCRCCGSPKGEGHESTDPCGIIAGLLEEYDRAAERARRIYSGLVGRLPIQETPADMTARVQARDELEAIFRPLSLKSVWARASRREI